MDKMGQQRAKIATSVHVNVDAMSSIVSTIPGAEADWLPPVPWWLVVTLSKEEVEKVWPWPECGGAWAEYMALFPYPFKVPSTEGVPDPVTVESAFTNSVSCFCLLTTYSGA